MLFQHLEDFFLIMLYFITLIIYIFKINCVFSFIGSQDVWMPPHPHDNNASFSPQSGDGKKPSYFWQSAPVAEWSKEQVYIDIIDIYNYFYYLIVLILEIYFNYNLLEHIF